MQQEVVHKKELMELEFQYNMQLKGMEVEGVKDREHEAGWKTANGSYERKRQR